MILLRQLKVSVLAVFIISGCATQPTNHKHIDLLFAERVHTLHHDQLDFNTIDAIILTIDQTPIAALRPESVKPYSIERELLGKNGKWECQTAGWDLIYIANQTSLQSLCGEYWIALEDRLTPKTPQRYDLIAIHELKYIEIGWGTSDNNLMIEQDHQSPGRFHWNYYTISGNSCSGEASFVLKP